MGKLLRGIGKTLFVVAFFLMVAAVWLAKDPIEIYRNKPFPILYLAALDGKPLSTEEWANTKQPIAINFFASWCPPCRAELPVLMQLKALLPVYGIAMKDSPAALEALFAKSGNPFTAIGLDPEGLIKESLQLRGIPCTIILDTTGKIIYYRLGEIDATEVEQVIAPLVKPLIVP
jgi:cytochrome c biogenesis protein CcmG/thiol:disulfide interchange protein DsbE